jgi:hypothetical protein
MQRDVVLRWIEQIARVVHHLLLGRGPGDLALARTHLEEARSHLLGPLAPIVPGLDPPSVVSLLHDRDRVLGLALLLDLEASVAEAEGRAAEGEEWRSRAAALRAELGPAP